MCQQFRTLRNCVIGPLHVCTFVSLCVSHTFRISVLNIISMFMTFQHLAICVEFHRPQAVWYERGKNCRSTVERVFPTKIDVDSMFTCSVAPLVSCFSSLRAHSEVHERLHHCVLRDCISSNRCDAHFRFHESDAVSIFVTKCPTDWKSVLFVIVDVATNKNSFQESNHIARCFVSRVRFMWCVFVCSTVTPVHITLHTEVLNPFGVSHCPLCNWMIKG